MTMLYKVNKLLFKRNIFNQFFRGVHNDQPPAKLLYPLENRKLLKVSGNDAEIFLQGLVTNDMRHFEEGAKSMYAMFLNNKGRVLYDTLIHKWEEENSYLLECDKNIIPLLQRHLKLYKLKRLVEIGDVSQDFKVWVFISPNILPDTNINPKSNVNLYKDPRIAELGYRILAKASTKEPEVTEILGNDVRIENNDKGYKYLRYKLGVSEGSDDLPPGTTFPLEVNCDYLHGVSFHKGCYIGQELTARVHHTGVVRKRIVPLKFAEEVNEALEIDSIISASDNPKSNLGKLRNYIYDYGIGLVRIKEAVDAKELIIGKHVIEILKPSWWPIEAPKDKATATKVE